MLQTFGRADHPDRGIYGVGEIRDYKDKQVPGNVWLRYLDKFVSPIPVHQPLPKNVVKKIVELETPKLRSLLSGRQENQRNFVSINSHDRPILNTILRMLEQHHFKADYFDPYARYPKEGRRISRLHFLRERNPRVIETAKHAFMAEHKGHLYCSACGFDFFRTYGDRGYGFIEGHHKLPLSKLRKEMRTRPEDIALLCSNCHRMIHNKQIWLSVPTLKELVRRNRARKD